MSDYPAELAVEPWTGAPPKASVRVPGSKSLTNRALIVAALAHGPSRLTGALDSDDTRVMVDAPQGAGDRRRARPAEAAVITIEGCGGRFPVDKADLFVGNSGTTLRFLTAALGRRQGHVPARRRPSDAPAAGLRPAPGAQRPGIERQERAGHRLPPRGRSRPTASTAATRSSAATFPASSSAAC